MRARSRHKTDAQTVTLAPPTNTLIPTALDTVSSAHGLPPAGEKASPAPSASGDLAHIGEPKARPSEAPKDPGPRPALHPQPITHTASRGNIRTSSGNTPAQLNHQELARQRSVAETPHNGILGFFGSLFH